MAQYKTRKDAEQVMHDLGQADGAGICPLIKGMCDIRCVCYHPPYVVGRNVVKNNAITGDFYYIIQPAACGFAIAMDAIPFLNQGGNQ